MYRTSLKYLLGAAVIAASTIGSIAGEKKLIGLSTIVEVPALLLVKEGVIEGLAEKGYVVGENLEIMYENANGNMPTQQQIMKKFAGKKPDLIVAITTPTAQAAVAGTRDIPIVFTAVTDPIKAKLIDKFVMPGGRVTGVSDRAPIDLQVALIRQLIPNAKKIGFIYNPGLDNALSALEYLKSEAGKLGMEVVESAAPTINEVLIAARKLVGKVDVIYVPNDTTVVSAFETIVKVANSANLPIIPGDTGQVKRGGLASIGHDYKLGGIHTGYIIAKILDGANPGDINSLYLSELSEDQVLTINLAAAKKLGIEIPQSLIDQADELIK